MMSDVKITIPPKLHPMFKGETGKRGALRYRCAYGGRGSGKSFNFALMAALWGYREPLKILCVREFQNSIPDSFYAEVKNAIASYPWLESAYDVGVNYIKGHNGTEFIFKGIRNNPQSVKSLAQIDLCIVEEAEDVNEVSWQVLEPTIRIEKSELWVIWNPKRQDSATNKRFIETPPPRCMAIKLNYNDNPWLSKELDEQRQHALQTLDRATYAWIWEGAYLKQSAAQVFAGKYIVEAFEPLTTWNGAYYGLDFGFAQDPTAGVKLWIADNRLYIEHEAVKRGLELDHTTDFLKEHLPEIEKYNVRADSARPESISFLQRHGIPRIVGADKGKGSVEDGIAFLKSFDKIVIHPRCTETIKEFDLYSYKTDKLSGDVLPALDDKFNHAIDAIRYALEPIMKARNSGFASGGKRRF